MPTYDARSVPTIEAFFDCDAFIRGLMGPFGSGKSSGAIMEIANRGIRQAVGPDGVRRTRWAAIRNTTKQLEDTTEKTFFEWFPPYQYGEWKASKHSYTIKGLRAPGDRPDVRTEIEVVFRALDRPEQASDLLSLDLTGGWVNEAREVEWSIIEALTGRLGRYPAMRSGGPTWRGLIMDTNPPDTESDWFKFFEEMDHSEAVAELAKIIPGLTVENFCRLFKQPSGRGPHAENLPNLERGYYQRLAIGKSPEWIKVYIDGQYGFLMEGKPVWGDYNDAVHCPTDPKAVPKPIASRPILRSWDFGLTPAIVFSQLTPRGQWIVFDEITCENMGAERAAELVLDHSAARYPGFEFEDVGDPAGAQRSQSDEKTCFQILHAMDILIEPAIQSMTVRLGSVERALTRMIDGKPRFQIHPRCTKLRRALMGGYHWRRLRVSGERYAEKPEKNGYSHVADALGYGGTKIFGAALFEQKVERPRSISVGHRIDDRTRSKVTGY
jgi:hypothetical protein